VALHFNLISKGGLMYKEVLINVCGVVLGGVLLNSVNVIRKIQFRGIPKLKGSWKVSYYDGENYIHEEDVQVKQFGSSIRGKIKAINSNTIYKFKGKITESRYIQLSFYCTDNGVDVFGSALYKLDSLAQLAEGEVITSARHNTPTSNKARVEFYNRW